MKALRTLIKRHLDYIDSVEGTLAEVDDGMGDIVWVAEEVGRHALLLGLPDLYRASLTATTLTGVRAYLSECLAACQPAKSGTLTPPQVAKHLNVNPGKVLSWIRSGELKAVNVTARRGGRAKYRITKDDLEAFTKGRGVTPAIKPRQQRQRRQPPGMIDFYPT
jgi:excisionase family DNA binding protein